jgi:hypothetical protein
VTAQGHPRATFNRAIERGNLLVAETVLREIGRPSLSELLELTILIPECEPRRHARVSARWLLRYLEVPDRGSVRVGPGVSARRRSDPPVSTRVGEPFERYDRSPNHSG